jgi:hypothetical protein
MAIGPDRVQVIKVESAALGGNAADDTEFSTPIEAQEDAIECAGLYLQDATARDETVHIHRDSGKLKFVDTENPAGFSLTQLTSGGGISEAAHKTLRQLIHLAEEGGPFEGFASGAFQEILPSANPFPTSFIWWTSNAKTHKIVELTLVYNANKTINTEQWKAYDLDGNTILVTVTDTWTYSGVFPLSRTRVVT